VLVGIAHVSSVADYAVGDLRVSSVADYAVGDLRRDRGFTR